MQEQRRLYKTEAIVLRHMPYREADRIVTLFTPRMGKVRALARGVRRVKSRLGGPLEQLTRVRVLVRRGRNLDVISQAETVESHVALREDLWKTACGVFMAELVDRFTTEDLESPRIFYLLADCLRALCEGRDPEMALRYFEVRLLEASGYQPELRHCVQCGSMLAPTAHFFSPQAGGVLCPVCRGSHGGARPLSLNALKMLRLMARGDLETAARVRAPEDLAVEVEGLLRQYIRHVLEQDLKSTEFLDMLRRERWQTPLEVRGAG